MAFVIRRLRKETLAVGNAMFCHKANANSAPPQGLRLQEPYQTPKTHSHNVPFSFLSLKPCTASHAFHLPKVLSEKEGSEGPCAGMPWARVEVPAVVV